MLKKRILALVCALACVITSANAAPLFTDIPEDSNEEKILNIVTGIGLMKGYDDGSFMPREAVKRGEIAQIICNALGYEYEVADEEIEWESEYLGDDSKDTELIVAESKESNWNDVPKNNWAYKAIERVNGIGIMLGDGNNNFRPEDTVTYNEAIKVILNLCGYEKEANYYGGYPGGYAKIASENGLYKGVSGTGDSKMSRMDIARLFYNSFELPVREYKYNGTGFVVTPDDEEIFMNDKMDVYAVTGALTQTDITSVDSDKTKRKGTASLNGFEFRFDDDKGEIRDYIGREIRIFVHKEDDDDYKLLCWEETGKDKITVINSNDFEKFSDNTFSYEVNGKIKTLKVDNGFSLIYNGKYLGTYEDDIFDFENGTITVIDGKNFDVDTVVVENYKSGYISVVDTQNMYIIDKLAEGSQNAVIDFEGDEDVLYSIYDTSGNKMQFDELANGAINYISNGGYIKLYYSSSKASGAIESVSTKDDGQYVRIDDVDYKISDQYLVSKNNIPLSNGMKITGYVDAWGNIVWITNESSVGNTGYLFKAYIDDENDTAVLRYFDLNTQAVLDIQLAEKVRFSNRYNETSRISDGAAVANLSGYIGIFGYEKNTDDQIKEIRIPLDSNVSSNDLRLRTMGNSDMYCNITLGTLGNYFMDANAKVVVKPIDEDAYNEYRCVTKSYIKQGTHNCEVYNYDARSKVGKIVVLKTTTNQTGLIDDENPLWVVTAVEQVYDDDEGEAVTQVTVSDGANAKTLLADVSVCTIDEVENAFGKTDSNGNKYKVDLGDLVRFQEYNGKVIAMQLVFDADAKNPAWYGADPAKKTTDIPSGNEDYCAEIGMIPGSTGYHHGKDDYGTYTNTNPFAYSYDIISGSARTFGNIGLHATYVYGFAHSEYEGYLTVTTQNLHSGAFDGVIDKDNYFTETFNPSGVNVIIIKKSGSRIDVKKGTSKDIRTYEQAGKACSKIMVCHTKKYALDRIFVFDF